MSSGSIRRAGLSQGVSGNEPCRTGREAGSDCPRPIQWRAFLEGGLSDPERLELEEHFDRCPHCVSVVERLVNLQPGGAWSLAADCSWHKSEMGSLLSLVHRPSPYDDDPPVRRAEREFPVLAGLRILDEVGRGGSGVVYRAQQAVLDREVAVKVLSCEALTRGRRRIEAEARALARLKHPHVVSIHEFGLTNEIPYLVMEWLAGGSLQDRIDQGPLAVRETALLIRQLAQAVDAVHALGIVHRDLKPANVLLEQTEPGTPLVAKLTDFGLAHDHWQQQRQSISGTVVGTPSYMAPEQTGLAEGLDQATTACDIYGLGGIAYAALTGQPPHRGRSTLDTLVRVATDEPRPVAQLRSGVPVDLATIVEKCLRQRPADRYATVADLMADLDRFLEGRPITARSSSRTERIWKWVRRRPAQAMASGLLLLLVCSTVIGVCYHLWHQREALRELEAEKRKVDQALQVATEAAATERRLKLQILQQLTLTPQMLLELINSSTQLSAAHRSMLAQIRETLRYHALDLEPVDVETAEVVAQGLSAVSYCEELRLGLQEEAQADLDAAHAVAARYTESAELRDLEVQLLVMRYRQALRWGGSARGAAIASQIRQLGERLVREPERSLGTDKTVLLASTLLELGHPAVALPLIRPLPGRYRTQLQIKPEDRVTWGQLFNVLILLVRLEEQVGDSAAAEATEAAWRETVAEARRWHPTLEGVFAQVEFELSLMKLTRAGRRGDWEGVVRTIAAARQQIAEVRREGVTPFRSALLPLRLARVVLDLPREWWGTAELSCVVEEALAGQAGDDVNDTDDGILGKLSAEVRSVWSTCGTDVDPTPHGTASP